MTVKKKGKRGNWGYDFMVRGVRYRESIPEAQTKHEALQAESDARRAVYEGRYGRQMSSTSFEQFVEEVFKPYAEQNRKRHSQDLKMAQRFIEFFKGRALQEIPPMLIEQYKKKAAQTLTPSGNKPQASTVNQKLALLHRIFSLAVDNDYLTQNPVRKVRRLKAGEGRTRVMSVEEESAIRQVMQDERYYNLKLFFDIANNTGMRAREITELKFSEIDFQSAEIRLPYWRTKEAKKKTIPLNAIALAVLATIRAERGGSDRVFGDKSSYGQMGHLWREVCKKVGVGDLHIHDLRHTFASRLLELGERETDINKILGHTKLRMTTRYLHSSAESQRRAVENLSQICQPLRKSAVLRA